MIVKRFHKLSCIVLLNTLLLVSTYYFWSHQEIDRTISGQSLRIGYPTKKCSEIQGVEDIVILLKTGANEVDQKLPVWMRTILKCSYRTLVFSDVEQEYQGIHLLNPLDGLLQRHLRSNDSDLIYYNQLQEAYANGTVSSLGREDGWKLDRFKYIPMTKIAYTIYPNAKWFVHIETDTAVVWSNLVTWLSHLDHQKPAYLGSEVVGGKAPDKTDYIFAHGGSGFILSQEAASRLSNGLSTDERKFFDYAKNDCCGDSALAAALWDVGVKITPSYPNSNGETPQTTFFTKEWCFAPVFFHHVDQTQIENVFLLDERKSSSVTLTFADVFDEFVKENLVAEKAEWDNLSEDDTEKDDSKAAKSFESCRAACSRNWECVQYNYREGECRMSNRIRYGRSTTDNIKSGWNLQRIEAFRKNHRRCSPKWIHLGLIDAES